MQVNIKPTLVIMLITLNLTSAVSDKALAADAEQNYAIWGEGSASCFRYSKARIAEDDKPFKSYIRGYLTAFNTVLEDTYNITGDMKLPEIMTWLDTYCDTKSIDSVDRALQMLIDEVEDQRYRTPVQKGISDGWGK